MAVAEFQCFGILWRRLSSGHGNIHGGKRDPSTTTRPITGFGLLFEHVTWVEEPNHLIYPEEVENQAHQEPTDLRQVPHLDRASDASSAVP